MAEKTIYVIILVLAYLSDTLDTNENTMIQRKKLMEIQAVRIRGTKTPKSLIR